MGLLFSSMGIVWLCRSTTIFKLYYIWQWNYWLENRHHKLLITNKYDCVNTVNKNEEHLGIIISIIIIIDKVKCSGFTGLEIY